MQQSRGFTLTEAMIVMTILAILTAVAVPSLRAITTANRISSEVQALLGDLQYARSEALRQGQAVVVCSVSAPSTQPIACAGSASWQSGWAVFSDVNGTGVFGAGDVVLRQQQPFIGGVASDTLTATPSLSAISFNRMGFSGLGSTVSFAFHDAQNRTAASRCLAVSPIGTVTLSAAGTGVCI